MKGRKIVFLISAAAVGIAALVIGTSWVEALRAYALNGIGIAHDYMYSEPEQGIHDLLNTLKAENERLKAELRTYEVIKQQLGAHSFDQYQSIPVLVIARPIDTFGSELIISKGIKSGVLVGAPVVIHNSILVGFITSSQDATATMQTLFHPSTNITVEHAASDPDTPSARGTLVSRHYSSLLVTTIPRDSSLQEEDSIITTGNEKNIPYGLYVGKVHKITSTESDPYLEARILPQYDIDDIRALSVLYLP